jgi:hypothetical protein
MKYPNVKRKSMAKETGFRSVRTHLMYDDEDPWGSVGTGLKRFFLPSDSDTDLFLMFVDVQVSIIILR